MQTPPLRRIYVDTQGWAEVFHAPALHHAQAVAFFQQAQAQRWELITSNLVLSEMVPLLHSRQFRLPQAQNSCARRWALAPAVGAERPERLLAGVPSPPA